jgi:uncharacterized protein HemX
VDWRSSSSCRSGCRAGSKARAGLAALLVALALGAAGCGMNAVRASEKEFLADRVMVFDASGQEASADDHIHGNREGAAGGRGTSGGGCGCN